jgi:hypothetical protein
MRSRCLSLVSLIIPVLGAALLAGCEPGTFYTDVKGETTIDGDPTPISTVLGTFPGIGSFTNMDFNANQDFQHQGVTVDQVSSVKVSALTLKITSPGTQGFDFLDEISFWAKVGSQESKVAEKTNITAMGLTAPNPVLSLDVTGAELQPFISAPTMSIIVKGRGRTPPQNTTLEAVARFKVDITLL